MNPLAGVLSEAWDLYRRHAPHFLIISFVIYLVMAALSALLGWGLGGFGRFLGAVLSVFGMYLLQAALVKAVQDVRDGRVDLDLRQTIEAALPSVLPVAIASVLAAIAITVGLLVFIVPGLILATFLSLIVPWIVIGNSRALESFGRSWRTVRGSAWHVFGTYVLVFLLLILADIIIALILSFLPTTAANFLAEIISGTLVAPFIAAVVTLVYYRLTAAHGEPAEPGSTPGFGGPGSGGGPGGPGSGDGGSGFGGPGSSGGPGDLTGPGDPGGSSGPSGSGSGGGPGSGSGAGGTSGFADGKPGPVSE
ncbi:MAG: hypothetical protein J2P26_01220 [Nocardiopsaceae bacterium]|nr:hypothetical protein [Nocardiopsaceae bacterium]